RARKFRDDLYFRVSTIPLAFPSLRERIEDIPIVARYLLDKLATDLGRTDIQLESDSIKALQSYSWPGNVRELRNVIERAVLLSEQKNIRLEDLHFDGRSGSRTSYSDSNLTLSEGEKQHIDRVSLE